MNHENGGFFSISSDTGTIANPATVKMIEVSKLVLLSLTVALVKSDETNFNIGKILSGEFELDDLNGFYWPQEAAEVCDAHPHCAGFTYRGKISIIISVIFIC